jgi:hypothetical protein
MAKQPNDTRQAGGLARERRRKTRQALVKMRRGRSHRWFRHLQRARRALMMTGAPERTDP